MTNDPQTELDWLRADIYGDDRDVTVLKGRRRGAIHRGSGQTERPDAAAWCRNFALRACGKHLSLVPC